MSNKRQKYKKKIIYLFFLKNILLNLFSVIEKMVSTTLTNLIRYN